MPCRERALVGRGGCWRSESRGAAALLAVADLAVARTSDGRGARWRAAMSPALERRADGARRDRRRRRSVTGGTMVQPTPRSRQSAREQRRRALAALAEMEIVADDDAGAPQLLRPSSALDESVGGGAGEAASKRRTTSAVEPEPAKRRELRRLRREAEQRLVRREELRADAARRSGPPLARRARAPPAIAISISALMAAMDAVEIADRHDRAAQGAPARASPSRQTAKAPAVSSGAGAEGMSEIAGSKRAATLSKTPSRVKAVSEFSPCETGRPPG